MLRLRNLSLEGFVGHFATAKLAFGLRNGTRVPGRCFAATKILVEGGLVAAK